MAQEEREGGEISDGEVSYGRDLRERDKPRERETDRRDEGRSRRDDSYLPVRESSSYTRYGRDWNMDRDRDRERRDERGWTRDTGRGRYSREPQDSWRDRDRERFYERDWERGPRHNYERPRERGWERDDRIRDRDRRYVDDDHYTPSYPRRPDLERHQRSPPRYSRARSPTRYSRRYSRSPSPRFAARVDRRRSISRSRDDASPRGQRRREESVDSKRSSTRRAVDDREQPNRLIQKRERSHSPSERSDRYRRRPRISRSRSPGVNTIRRSPSPALRLREEKQPERYSPVPLRSGPPEAPAPVAEPHDHHETRVAPPITPTGPQRSQQYLAETAISRISIDPITTTFRNYPAPSPAGTVGNSASSTPLQRASTATPTQAPMEVVHASSPKVRAASPPKPPPTGPRSAAAHRAPRVPEIPEYNRADSPTTIELDRITTARIPLYTAYAHADMELRRATREAELAAIELRSAEYRRTFAEQQHKNALET